MIVDQRGLSLAHAGNVFLALLLTACAPQSSVDDIQKELIADQAYDIQKRNIADTGVAQLTYKVRLDFPKQAIDSDRATMLRGHGWVECSTIPPWEGYADIAMQPSRFIHQSQRTFVKGSQLLAVGMQYLSHSGKQRSTPDSNEQHVLIMKYDIANEGVKQQMSVVFPECFKKK
jgi:hypothetical protein